MNQHFHNQIISKVKKTIHKVTHPARQRSASADYLVKVNIPPQMGRRDAAYEQVKKLLKPDSGKKSPSHPDTAYQITKKLLHFILDDTRDVAAALHGDERQEQELQLFNYFRLLENIISSADGLNTYGRALFKEKSEFNDLMEEKQLLEIEKVFSASGRNIAKSIDQLLLATDHKIIKLRDRSKKSLSRRNAARYKNAFEKYSGIYQKEFSDSL